MKVEISDLLDAQDVADELGLAHRQAIATYRSRYHDFPVPVLVKASGKCVLWLRTDVEAWRAKHPARER